MKKNLFWPAFLAIVLIYFGCETQKPLGPEDNQDIGFTSLFKISPPLDTIIIITDFFTSAEFPCAVNNSGEIVEFSSGVLHIFNRISFDELGHRHVTSHVNAANIEAIGKTSGSVYRVTGASKIDFQLLNPGTYTTIAALPFGLRGSEANSLLQLRILYTLSPYDELQIKVLESALDCISVDESANS